MCSRYRKSDRKAPGEGGGVGGRQYGNVRTCTYVKGVVIKGGNVARGSASRPLL
jgi:hypothetical protein